MSYIGSQYGMTDWQHFLRGVNTESAFGVRLKMIKSLKYGRIFHEIIIISHLLVGIQK